VMADILIMFSLVSIIFCVLLAYGSRSRRR